MTAQDAMPDPMTPADCDLRGYDYMPLFGHRLFRSQLYRKALRDPRAGLAAIKLWWEAWQQCPAGSLPDDDDDLAMLADFGLDTKAWTKVRALALHGFVKCSDGRFYHPIIASEAILAFERRKKERDRKAANRRKKEEKGGTSDGSPQDVPRDTTWTEAETGTGTATGSHAEGDGRGQDRTGQDRDKERKKERAELRSDAGASFDARKWIWSDGLQAVREMTGLPDGKARSLVGQWAKSAGDDIGKVVRTIVEAQDLRPLDPVAWMTKALISNDTRKAVSVAEMRAAMMRAGPQALGIYAETELPRLKFDA